MPKRTHLPPKRVLVGDRTGAQRTARERAVASDPPRGPGQIPGKPRGPCVEWMRLRCRARHARDERSFARQGALSRGHGRLWRGASLRHDTTGPSTTTAPSPSRRRTGSLRWISGRHALAAAWMLSAQGKGTVRAGRDWHRREPESAPGGCAVAGPLRRQISLSGEAGRQRPQPPSGHGFSVGVRGTRRHFAYASAGSAVSRSTDASYFAATGSTG
jgi:hypothetical protein